MSNGSLSKMLSFPRLMSLCVVKSVYHVIRLQNPAQDGAGPAPEAFPEPRANAGQATDAAPGRPPTPHRAGHRRRTGQATDAAPGRPPTPHRTGHPHGEIGGAA